MSPKKTRLTLALGMWALFALVTCGGWRVVNIRGFGAQRDIVLVEGLKSDIWLAPTKSYIGLPLLVHFTTLAEPYSIRLQVWDKQSRYRTITVDTVVVVYADGSTTRQELSWSTPFKKWAGGLSARANVPNVVPRHVGHRLTITGRLEEIGGASIPFELSASFRPRSRSWSGSNLMYYNQV